MLAPAIKRCRGPAAGPDGSMTTEVKLLVSSDLFGGDSRGFLKHIGVYGRHIGGELWAIRPTEDRSFLRCFDLADETGFAHRFDYLEQIPQTDAVAADYAELAEQFRGVDEQLAQRRLSPSDHSALFHQIQLNILRVGRGELERVVRDSYSSFGQMRLEASGELLAPHRSAQLIIGTDLLISRARLPGMSFRFDQDPNATETIAAVQASGEAQGFFSSSSPWFRDVIGGVHYLGPLLGCLSPRTWCVPTVRLRATILFSFGRDINGYRHTPMEPMQLIPVEGRHEPMPHYELQPGSCRHAVHWWVKRLNQMFDYLLDPTTFANIDGDYDPYEHQHWLLTISQVFGLTTALQTSGRNRAAQHALMNTLLDTYDGRLLGRDFADKLCTWREAKKVAHRVRARMPADVAPILMAAADRAVNALEYAQKGFFISEQRGDSDVSLQLPGRDPELKSRERAVALLLKVLRNATHGFGGRSSRGSPDTPLIEARLLAQWDGELPTDVFLLPYLYLLEILSDPDGMRARIRRSMTGAR